MEPPKISTLTPRQKVDTPSPPLQGTPFGATMVSVFDQKLLAKTDMTPLLPTMPLEVYEEIRHEGIFPHLKPVVRRFIK